VPTSSFRARRAQSDASGGLSVDSVCLGE
jgi:hypothetical protein